MAVSDEPRFFAYDLEQKSKVKPWGNPFGPAWKNV
jgi:hypothetical protein